MAPVFLWGVSPVRVEALFWASALPYTLCGVCVACSVWCCVRSVVCARGAGYGSLVLSQCAVVCGMLCKSVAVPVPLVLVGLHLTLRRVSVRVRMRESLFVCLCRCVSVLPVSTIMNKSRGACVYVRM